MKDNAICPKCKSEDIYYVENVVDRGDYLTTNNLILGIKKDFWQGRVGGEVEAYICSKCGFIELFLKNTEELAKSLAKKIKE